MNHKNLLRWLFAAFCSVALCAACQESSKPQAKTKPKRHHRIAEPKEDDTKEEAAAEKENATARDAVGTELAKNDARQSPESQPAKDETKEATDEPKASKTPANDDSSERQGSIDPAARAVAAQGAFADQLDPADLIVPKVLLTRGYADTCKVNVGEQMPDIQLTDIAGKKQSLAKLLGSKLTVVLFWRAGHPYDVEELGDLAADVATPYSEHGASVVTIFEGSSAEEAKAALEQVGATLPVLMDPQGKALDKVAVGKLPRTYLLDAKGKVLWFDMHYTRSTRRDLLRAVRFLVHER